VPRTPHRLLLRRRLPPTAGAARPWCRSWSGSLLSRRSRSGP